MISILIFFNTMSILKLLINIKYVNTVNIELFKSKIKQIMFRHVKSFHEYL